MEQLVYLSESDRSAIVKQAAKDTLFSFGIYKRPSQFQHCRCRNLLHILLVKCPVILAYFIRLNNGHE